MWSVVRGMGLDWKSQHRKLESDRERFACGHMATHDSLGRQQQKLCIPLRRYPMWLATITRRRSHGRVRNLAWLKIQPNELRCIPADQSPGAHSLCAFPKKD